RVGRERAGREIVGNTGVVAAVVCEHLAAAGARRIPDNPDSRRPVVLELKPLHQRAGQALLLVPHTPPDRQRTPNLPLVLDEHGTVPLGGLTRGGQAGAAHVVNLAEDRIRNDVDGCTGRRLLTVRRGERRTRILLQLAEVQMLEVESVADLMLTVPR